MLKLIGRRLASLPLIIFLLTAILFLLQRASGVNPVHAYLGPNASQAAVKREETILGYNRPMFQQYITYLERLFQGNLGRSLATRRSVLSDIGTFLPATIELLIAGLIVAMALGILLALTGTFGGRASGAIRYVLVAGSSIPPYMSGLILIYVFSNRLNWLPGSGDTGSLYSLNGPTHIPMLDAIIHGSPSLFVDSVEHLILPSICIAIGPAVSIGRVLYNSLRETLTSDFIRSARSKGLKERDVVFRHTLRNSANAALSMTGLQIGYMLGGVFVVETTFAWPGIGSYTAQAIPLGDFPAIAGVTLVLGIGYVLINMVIDLLQLVIDPRVSRDG